MYIALEGGEGSGKSTIIKAISKHLDEKHVRHITTREPGNTSIGKQIRSILLDKRNTDILPMTELLLYVADRYQHSVEIVGPTLETGDWVISDRSVHTGAAVQGGSREMTAEYIYDLHKTILGDSCRYLPDKVILIDVPSDQGIARARRDIESGNRDSQDTRFEDEAIESHNKVRKTYLELQMKNPDTWYLVDGRSPIDIVVKDILAIIDELLEQN